MCLSASSSNKVLACLIVTFCSHRSNIKTNDYVEERHDGPTPNELDNHRSPIHCCVRWRKIKEWPAKTCFHNYITSHASRRGPGGGTLIFVMGFRTLICDCDTKMSLGRQKKSLQRSREQLARQGFFGFLMLINLKTFCNWETLRELNWIKPWRRSTDSRESWNLDRM